MHYKMSFFNMRYMEKDNEKDKQRQECRSLKKNCTFSNRLQHYAMSGIFTCQITTVPSVYLYPYATNRCPRARIH